MFVMFIKIFSSGFYDTARGRNFDPNHWKSDSSLEEIRAIEENCLSLISLLNYSIYNSEKTTKHENMER